jgi:anti-anti-sigma factor
VERSSGAAPPLNPGGSDQNGSAPLTVRIEESAGGAAVFAIAGELDLSTIPRMESPLLEQVRQRSALLLDLTNVSFIDSSGIGALIRAFHESDGAPIHVVVGKGSQVERVFQVARVTDTLSVFSDREPALAALNGTGEDPGG